MIEETTKDAAPDAHKPLVPHAMGLLAVPIILAWLVITVAVSTFVPSLAIVSERHSAPMAPMDAPSMQAMLRMGQNFQEFSSNSTVMIVLEGQDKLGEPAHQFYNDIVGKLEQDHEHIQHVQNFWGDPLTAAGSQSSDVKAAYVMVYLAGNQGTTLANESVEAVRKAVDGTYAPPGVKAYVTGSTATANDMHVIGNASIDQITLYTLVAIAVMLLIVYRSIVTTLIQLFMTGIALVASRGVVAALGNADLFEGLTTFASNVLTGLAIAAATDYGIFLFGRYGEARRAGEDRETAYYTTFRSVAPVIIGSGLTIAGATFCLSFTRLPYFQTMGAPVAIGMLVVVASAITLGPAALFLGSKFGLFEPKRATSGRFWRRVGIAVVRWPAPIMVTSGVVVLIGMVAIPGFKPGYDQRFYLPESAPANLGYAAADRHFSQARMDPDILMIEADHDMRNPADMLVLDRVARSILDVVGIELVQGITRPLGVPIEHSSIPFQISMQGQVSNQNLPFTKDSAENMRKITDEMQNLIDNMEQIYAIMQRLYDVMEQIANTTHSTAESTKEMEAITAEMRDHVADFDDFWRPIRNYFYWEPHCYDIPICWSFRSVFDSLDSIDGLADVTRRLTADIEQMDTLMPQTVALMGQMIALMPPMINTMKTMRVLSLTMYSTMLTSIEQGAALSDTAMVMGQSFDTAQVGDFFYLAPEAFSTKDFQTSLKQFLSPDGKSARFFITHQGDPATPEGIAKVPAERTAAQEAIKQTSLSEADIYLAGDAPTMADIAEGAKFDMLIAVVAALTLIFTIMLIVTRALVAALVIVGTAASSIAAAFGISVFIWQDLIGLPIFWATALMSIIILLAVGADYNLLLVSRFKEEIYAGIKTGFIRSMAGTGTVVTAAGMVFAVTMAAMIFSDLRVIGQLGSTVAIGLLIDTLIVRSLLMPSIATLLGRWFWWPMRVRPRPPPQPWPPANQSTTPVPAGEE